MKDTELVLIEECQREVGMLTLRIEEMEQTQVRLVKTSMSMAENLAALATLVSTIAKRVAQWNS